MGIKDMLEELRRWSPQCGEFILRPRESINDVVARECVSTDHGVYLISSISAGRHEIIYVGKAGTIRQDGTLKEQGIRKRITMKQDGGYRRVIFQEWIAEATLEGLRFEWFVTFDGTTRRPPFLVEAQLLAAHLESFGRLPAHNRTA